MTVKGEGDGGGEGEGEGEGGVELTRADKGRVVSVSEAICLVARTWLGLGLGVGVGSLGMPGRTPRSPHLEGVITR